MNTESIGENAVMLQRGPNLDDLLGADLANAGALLLGSALAITVRDVLRLRAQREVVRVDAIRHVAGMHHYGPGRDHAVCQGVAKP